MSAVSAKRRAQLLRFTIAVAPLNGIALYALSRYFLVALGNGTTTNPIATNSLLFGDTSHWWPVFNGFVPFDISFVSFCSWCVLYFGMQLSEPRQDQRSETFAFRDVGRLVLRIFAITGSVGGLIATLFGGWFHGMEAYLLAGIGAILAMSGLMLSLAIFVAISILLVRAAGVTWRLLEPTPIGQRIVRIGQYFNADDVPDEPYNTNLTT